MRTDDWRALYEDARHSPNFDNTRLNHIAQTTDDVVDELMDQFEQAGLNFPGDDRVERLVTEIFRIAVEANP